MHENAAPCHSLAAVLTVGSLPDADGLRELGEALRTVGSTQATAVSQPFEPRSSVDVQSSCEDLEMRQRCSTWAACHQGLDIARKRKHTGRLIGIIRGAN